MFAILTTHVLPVSVDPARTIAVGLDVGTNNQKLLDDELYVGWRNKRVRGEDYDAFVGKFADLVKKHFPNALLHFEDFGRRGRGSKATNRTRADAASQVSRTL